MLDGAKVPKRWGSKCQMWRLCVRQTASRSPDSDSPRRALARSVRQSCYNVTEVPDPEVGWLCDVCEITGGVKSLQPRCCLCPVEGGALKRTVDPKKWAHVACVQCIPEVFFDFTRWVRICPPSPPHICPPYLTRLQIGRASC